MILVDLTPWFAVRFYCLVGIFWPFLFLTLCVTPPYLAFSPPFYFTPPSPPSLPPSPSSTKLNLSPLSLFPPFLSIYPHNPPFVSFDPPPLLHPTHPHQLTSLLTSLADDDRSGWTCSVKEGPDFMPTALVRKTNKGQINKQTLMKY